MATRYVRPDPAEVAGALAQILPPHDIPRPVDEDPYLGAQVLRPRLVDRRLHVHAAAGGAHAKRGLEHDRPLGLLASRGRVEPRGRYEAELVEGLVGRRELMRDAAHQVDVVEA